MTPEHKAVYDSVKDIESEFLLVYEKARKRILNYLDIFNTENGRFEINSFNIEKASIFFNEYKKILIESGYNEFLKKNQKSDIALVKHLQKIQENSDFPLIFTQKDKNVIKGFELLDFKKLQMLGENSANILSRGLISNVILGESLSKTRKSLESSLSSKLKGYVETYINTSKHLLFQEVHNLSAENQDDDIFWQYVGPADDKTRPECSWALKKNVFTDIEKQNFISKYGVRFNCRHVFIEVTEDFYKERNGKKKEKSVTPDHKKAMAKNFTSSSKEFNEMATDIFSESPENIKKVIDKTRNIKDVTWNYDGGSHVLGEKLRMGENCVKYSPKETLAHEFGHYIDYQQNVNTEIGEGRFSQVLRKNQDKWDWKLKPTKPKEMEAWAYENLLVDNDKGRSLSNLNYNTIQVADFFKATTNNNVGWGHSDDYFSSHVRKEKEAFANLFSLFARNKTKEIEFINKYMPEMIDAFNETIENILNGG